MNVIEALLGLLAIVALCLAGIAGVGVLTAHRLAKTDRDNPDSTTPAVERKNQS